MANIFLMLVASKKYSYHKKGKLNQTPLQSVTDHSSVGHNLPFKDIFPGHNGDKSVCDSHICLTKSGKSLESDKLISPVGLDRKKNLYVF